MFSRAYWSPDVQRPALNTAVAFLLAPLPVISIALVAGWSLDAAASGDLNFATDRAISMAPIVVIACYAILLTLGLLAFFALWALGRGGGIDYALAGAAVGALTAALAPMMNTDLSFSPVFLAVSATIFLLIFVTLRWIAGIRPLSRGA